MNYEELYEELAVTEKDIREKNILCQKLWKALVKETEAGDLKTLARDTESFARTAQELSDAVQKLSEKLEGFDTEEYFKGGDFENQMLRICESEGVDVHGEAPVYEMFPYKVKVDSENQDLYLDRKKIQCMRPSAFVEMVKTGQKKLQKAPFKAELFADELADAYDMALLKMNKKAGCDLYLQNLYKIMTPMSRARKEYDQQSFAFDLARLYASGLDRTRDGRRFQFGPSRNNGKAVRILDGDGKEQFLATVRFFL